MNKTFYLALLTGTFLMVNHSANASMSQSDADVPDAEATQQGDNMSDNNLNNAWENTKQAGSDVWEATKNGASQAGDTISEKSGEAWEATKDASGKAWDATKETTAKAWDATKEGAAKAGDAISEKLN